MQRCDKSGWTPLHYAAHVGSSIELLFELADPEVDAVDEFGQTPLMLASAAGNMDEVAALFQHDADIERRNPLGCTPIHIATVRCFG